MKKLAAITHENIRSADRIASAFGLGHVTLAPSAISPVCKNQ
jgi:hypothetical protein